MRDRLRRREFLELAGGAGLALAALPALAARPEASRPPNILLVMADDLGYECLGCNGGTSYATPRLDQMAREGMRFEHCYSQPLCTPSRVQLMTGIYNNRNYVRFGYLDPAATTFAQLLGQAGYATGIAGKWQLGGGADRPHHFGFDEHALWHLIWKGSRYWQAKLSIGGELVAHGLDRFAPDLVSDYLCGFMERNRERPFLAYYPMILPHSPFARTPADFAARRRDGAEGGAVPAGSFGGLVAYMDQLVGKLLDKLDELGIAEQTLVIFCGDNGTDQRITSMMGDTPVEGGKSKTRDAGVHVPMIARWPGTTPAGRVTDALIDFSDLLPTFTDLAGAPRPAGVELDGVSFARLLRGVPFEGRRWIYSWYQRNGVRGSAWQLARDRRYKLYASGRFFDVRADPDESSPIATGELDEAGRAAHALLEAMLASHMAVAARVSRSMGEASQEAAAPID